MRKQYYFRQSDRGILAWDVDLLIDRSKHLPRKQLPLDSIREFDAAWHGDEEHPTWREIVKHIKLIPTRIT